MTRSYLAKRLARQFSEISGPEAKELLDHFLLAMKEGLESGDTVELRDFGVLRVRTRGPRRARNPKTGESVRVGVKKTVFFKQGRTIKKKMMEKKSDG